MQTLEQSRTEALDPGVARQWDAAAAGWDRHGPAIRAWLRESTDAMLGMAGIAPGMHVLDLAAGAGDQTLDVAARVGPAGTVTAVDLSAEILARAADNLRRAGYANVRTEVADAQSLPFESRRFDAAVCRLGLMFLPDPARGVSELHRVLKPGARACVMVFSRPERNPCIGTLMSTALKHAGLTPRDPYQPGGLLSLGKPGLLDALLRDAGFGSVATTAVDAAFRLPTVDRYLEFVRDSATPIVQILAALSDTARAAAWQEMRERLQAFGGRGGWEGPNELLLTVGRR